MSRFNTIKKSRKRSHEIDEKLNVLNRELEKTKDIREITLPTMHTGDMYTSVQQSDPSDFQGPLDVPNTAGVGDDDFTQSSAGSGEDGDAPSYSDTSQLNNSSLNRPVFQSPNDIEGAAASYGLVEYTGTGAGTNYGIIVNGNIVELVLGGFIAGGTRAAQFYVDEYEAAKATNAANPGYYSDEFIDAKRIAAARATSAEGIRNSAAAKGLEFNIPWQGYRTPQFGESLDGRTTFSHGELGTLVLAGFSLLGMPETYHIGGDRGGTTAGPSKGTGDPDQYPPLPFGPEAFDKLDKESKKKEVKLAGANYDMYNWILKTYGMPAAEWYLKTGKTQGNPFAPYGSYFPRASNPYTGAKDGDEFAFFGGNNKKNTPPPAPTKRTRKGTMDATKASTGMYPSMTPAIFLQKYGISYNEYLLLNHFKPKGDLLKENAYMALLHRDYRPHEQDYVKYGAKTPEEKKIFDAKVKRVLAYVKKRPDRLEYVMKRYPKSDPRLSMLNYKMDNMTEASDEYLEKQFPTNQALFTKVKERTKKNMNLTDPKNFKPVKDPIKYVDVKNTKKLKETVARHFNKPVKSKSMFGLSISKVKKKNQKMIEKREKEQQIKDDEKAYINEKMSRQKSNWKDDLTEV